MTKVYELPNERMIMADVDEKHHTATVSVYALDELVAEVNKTGHWIAEDMFDGDVAYRCSECNELFWIESGTPKDNEYNFCPKCGAKMVQESEENNG